MNTDTVIDPTEHQKLAWCVCNRYRKWQSAGFDMDDLFQEAMIGIVKASRTYDPTRAAWSTYAVKVASGHVRRHISATMRTVHVPEYVQAKYGDPNMARVPVARGRKPKNSPDFSLPAQIPDHVKVVKLAPGGYPDRWDPPPHDPQHPCHSTGAERSLDLSVGEDCDDTMHDVTSAFSTLHEAQGDVEDVVEARERAAILKKLVDALPPREQAIMLDLLSGERKVDIAAKHSVSAVRIGQIAEQLAAKFADVFENDED